MKIEYYDLESDKKQTKNIPKTHLWNLFGVLANSILPKLIAFRKIKRMGYPSNLRSFKQWERILDEMIFAFYWIVLAEGNTDKSKIFFKELYPEMVNPYRKTKDNLRYCKTYKTHRADGLESYIMEFEDTPEPTQPDMESCREHYFDLKAYDKCEQRCVNGLKLFSKYFRSLWD